jgi:hypothetical protein
LLLPVLVVPHTQTSLAKNKVQNPVPLQPPQKVPASQPRSPRISPQTHHKFTTPHHYKIQKPPPKSTTSPQQTFSRRKIRANPHPDRYHPAFPQQNPRSRRLYLENMSTSTDSPSISADEFQALEQKVLRAVEIVKREREARAAAEAEVASLREQLAAQQSAASANETELNTLNKEREAVRLRVEKMLQQMDELL